MSQKPASVPRGVITVHDREAFLDKMSKELLALHERLDNMSFFMSRLQENEIDDIEASLQSLADEAASMGEGAKAEMLRRLANQFFLLNTVGYAVDFRKEDHHRTPDEREATKKRAEQCAHAFAMLEMALLAMDGFVRGSRGRIMAIMRERAEREGD